MRRAKSVRLAVIGLAGALALPFGTAHGQGLGLTDVEFDAGIGYSAVNAKAWVGSGTLLTSNRLASGGDGRVIFFAAGPLRVGAEVGYHYYWSFQAIFGTNAVLRNVDADHVSLLARIQATSRISLDVGGGLQFFDGFNDPGFQAALRYNIPVNPRLSIPLGLRADVILDSNTTLVPVMLTAGFALKP